MRHLMVMAAAWGIVASGGCQRPGERTVVGSGIAKTESRDVGNFHAIDFAYAGRIDVHTAPYQPLKVTADENLLPLLRTEVVEGRLVIRPRRDIRPKAGIRVAASAPGVELIRSAGAGDIHLAQFEGERLAIEVAGAGQVTLAGTVDKLKVTVTGAGDVNADGLTARQASISTTGAGTVDVHVMEKLDVAITGTGSVRYLGAPEVTERIIGLGSVSKK